MYNTTFVGLDVHKDTITIAKAKGYSEIQVYGTINNDFKSLTKCLVKFGEPKNLMVCYEAGPCGYEIYRHLEKKKIKCLVVAPSLIPKAPGDKIKNDRRDAKTLARALRNGDLSPVWVPDKESEALRDLVRAREAAVQDQHRARQRLKKFLLRYNYRPPEKVNSWTVKYEQWLNSLKFNTEEQNIVFQEYLQAIQETTLRIERLEKAIKEQRPQDNFQTDFIKALKGLRGVDTITATTITSELGDPRRFSHPRYLMSYLGAIPSESSSGNTRRQGSITKTGNAHLRRVVIEAAWHYFRQPKVSYRLRKRQDGLSTEIKDISWRAQLRLNKRYRCLIGRGKPKQIVVVALARELVAFIWEIGQQVARERDQQDRQQQSA